jgi:tol-pal system protein YbgF
MVRANHFGLEVEPRVRGLGLLGTVQSQVDTFSEKMNQYSKEVNRFGTEIPSLRAGLDQQQKLLDKIFALLNVAPPTAPSNASAGAPPPSGTPLPASPAAVFTQAKNQYFSGDFELAVRALEDFVQKFPDATAYVGEAEYWIGMSQFKRANYPAAVTALKAIIETYKTSDKVPDAYYQLGECYRALGKRTEAGAAYDQVIKLFPDSPAAMQAKQSKLAIK